MTSIYCFAPIESDNARMLILGSMPGKESLRLGQYYAHPRNSFWPIIGQIIGIPQQTPYELRTKMLKTAGIALWDVLASCRRVSSLDSDIDSSTIHPNDFVAFFLAHPHIDQVFFNGAMAEQCYRKQVLPTVEALPIRYLRLPSTSPAHAALPYDRKLEIWRSAIEENRASPRQTEY